MQTAVKKVIRVGRATALVIGVGVVLAMVLGVATVALAAVPGDPFRLGQLNDALSAGTGLTSDRSGPTLELSNTNDGSTTERVVAPPLGLSVGPGQPPLTVNPGAGTATNLDADKLDGLDQGAFLRSGAKAADSDKLDGKDSASFANGTNGKANDANLLDGVDSTGFLRTTGKAADADKLDGKDGSAFASGTGGKANDSDKLDGKDSQGFFSGKSYKVKGAEGTVGTGNGQLKFRQARCDWGDALLAGGYDVDPGDIVIRSEPDLIVLIGEDGPGWTVTVQDNGPGNLMSATALCADFPPFHQ